ncbi:MAG: efflux RND transporter permease subunit [Acidimicrobiales bacterium]
MNITRLSIKRPITVLMVLGFFVLAGIGAFPRIPVRRLPNVNFPFLRVTVGDPGTSASTMSSTVTAPIERALSVETGLVSMVGTSAPGRSVVAMQFSSGTNIDTKAASVSLALSKLARSLPTTATPPSIIKANPSALPMMNVALYGPLSSSQLYNLATNIVAPALQEVSGVAQVTVVGGRAPIVNVNVHSSALNAYGISMSQVTAAMRAQNTAVTGGLTVVGSKELLSRVHGGYTSVSQLQSLPVASKAGGAVLLGDVATVSSGLAHAQSNATLNGHPAVGMVITASSTANSLQVDSQIRSTLAGLSSQMPAGVSTAITGDVTNYVRAALSNVELDLFLGIFIAALILALFLHKLTNTLIVVLAIPVSVVSTFAAMYFMGFSLDLISLMALSLLIGILVDDSIVVLENIHRHRAMGKSPDTAAVDGRMEIGAAAVAITLTDVVVYAPVAFASGNVGQLFREFGLTIVIATLFSLLVSYTLTPMLAAKWTRREPSNGRLARFGRWFGGGFDRGFDRVRSGYRRVITFGLGHRLVVASVAVAAALASVAMITSGVLPTTFVPPEDNGVLTVNASLPVGTPLATSQATLASLAKRVQKLKGVTQVFTSSGYGGGKGAAHNIGQITVDLAAKGTRPPIKSYVKQVGKLAKRYPGLVAHGHVQNPLIAGGARAASINLLGPDLGTLNTLATQIAGKLTNNPAVSQVSTSVASATPELAITVNHATASYLGVSTASIGSTVATAIGGAVVPPLVTSPTAPSETIQVSINNSTHLTPAQISAIPISTGHGTTVPLSTVATLTEANGASKVTQINREYSVSVSASSATGNTGPAQAALTSAANSVGLPTGYSMQTAGAALQQKQAFGPLIQAFVLSVILVYMLMAALYESLADPLAILLAVPLATVGALAGLWIGGLPISIFALLAMIMLMGLVAKNSILLIDYTKTLMKRGYARNAAIVEAGSTRIRPILMTSVTMIGAMLPLAISQGAGASQRQPIAAVLIGGLTSSTLLTLLVVPVLYSLIEDGVDRLFRRRRLARASGSTAGNEPGDGAAGDGAGGYGRGRGSDGDVTAQYPPVPQPVP